MSLIDCYVCKMYLSMRLVTSSKFNSNKRGWFFKNQNRIESDQATLNESKRLLMYAFFGTLCISIYAYGSRAQQEAVGCAIIHGIPWFSASPITWVASLIFVTASRHVSRPCLREKFAFRAISRFSKERSK